MSFYIVRGIRGLEGLIVEGLGTDHCSGCVEIVQLINRNAIMGDRNVTIPLDRGTLFIHESVLECIENPGRRQYGSDNPWGKCLFEGRYTKDNIDVAYARYEKGTQVSVLERQDGHNKTLFTRYCQGVPGICDAESVFELVKETIEKHLGDRGDVDDLIFALKNLEDNF